MVDRAFTLHCLILSCVHVQCREKSRHFTNSSYPDRRARLGVLFFDFSTMQLWRGAACRAEGYPWTDKQVLILPLSEDADEYLYYFKSSNYPLGDCC